MSTCSKASRGPLDRANSKSSVTVLPIFASGGDDEPVVTIPLRVLDSGDSDRKRKPQADLHLPGVAVGACSILQANLHPPQPADKGQVSTRTVKDGIGAARIVPPRCQTSTVYRVLRLRSQPTKPTPREPRTIAPGAGTTGGGGGGGGGSS